MPCFIYIEISLLNVFVFVFLIVFVKYNNHTSPVAHSLTAGCVIYIEIRVVNNKLATLVMGVNLTRV